MAPLQKRALYSFVVGLALTIALIAVLVAQGDVTAFDKDPNLRLVMYAVLVDERGRLIMERSSRAQWLAVIFALVVWTIALTEIYRDQGQVPIAFLQLIFMSTLIISTLARSLGILVGYREMNRDG
jgi:O-antigen/teichoic acid export membrane protein